jgi:hypothetical protein
MRILPTKCCVCGNLVDTFYDHCGEWWEKYLKPDETEVCLSCIKGRRGFRREFHEKSGMTVTKFEREHGCL